MKTEIISEVGQAHDGSLGTAHAYIDAVTDCLVDTVKFQIHIADAESSKYDSFRKNFSYQDKSRYDSLETYGIFKVSMGRIKITY